MGCFQCNIAGLFALKVKNGVNPLLTIRRNLPYFGNLNYNF